MALNACSSEEVLQQLSADERFGVATQLFQEEDYLEAEKEFRIITLQYPGTALADDAQFFLGECRFLHEEYILAAYEYDMLLRTMPTSEYVSRARYRKSQCYYNLSPESFRDQENTRKAIDEFQAFLEYFPTDTLAPHAATRIQELNEKLAKKEYDNGELYFQMGSYRSAAYYFDLVLEKYHDTPFAEQAQLKKAEVGFLRKRYSEAKLDIDLFFEKYPNSSYLLEAEKLRSDIDTQLSGAREGTSKERSTSPNPIKQN